MNIQQQSKNLASNQTLSTAKKAKQDELASLKNNSENANNPDIQKEIEKSEHEVAKSEEKRNRAQIELEKSSKKVEDLKIKSGNNSICEYLTISIGLGNIKKVKVGTSENIVYAEVDKLLYESKNNGRNQISIKNIII